MSLSTSTIIGIDIGGTKTALGLVDAQTKEVLATHMIPTGASRGFPAVMTDVLSAMTRMRRADTIAIGLGVAGFIDCKSQRIVQLPNIPGAEGSDPRSQIAATTGLPVTIENDAKCFAYAEAILGAGKGERVVVGITLGTGVGGGIVIDGKIFEGARGFAGEIGHMLLVPGYPPFETSDRRGEVEQFLSGTAMGKRCEAASRPQDYLEGAVCGFMQPEIIREVAWVVTNLTHCIDPDVIVFGGSAGQALRSHLRRVKEELMRWMLPGISAPRLEVSTLKHAAILGAALCARRTSSST